MRHSSKTQQQVITLRKKGFSYSEISTKTGIAKSTIYSWTKRVTLSQGAKDRLSEVKHEGVKKGAKKNKLKMMRMRKDMNERGNETLKNVHFSKSLLKILCSFLYWGEGNKSGSYVAFINSDPQMIEVFMLLLRKSFKLDEKKFRILVHIHEYHHEENVLKFWSKTTQIPLGQFSKSYLKLNTKKRRKPSYMGSARIRYYDVKIVRELQALYNAVAQEVRAVG